MFRENDEYLTSKIVIPVEDTIDDQATDVVLLMVR